MATIDRTRIAKPSPIVEDEQGQLRARQGISREVVSELSKIKGEPDWMAEKRLKSLEIFERKPIPTWGPDLSGLNLDDLVLYSPPTAGRFNSWDDVPAEMKQTYEDLGIPQAEREHLAGVVGVWRQEPVYEGLKEEYAKQGILFCSMDTAITEYPELVQKYFMNKCVPPQDNKFSALHGAVWSGGAFCYIPKGVKCDLPLQSYFRMEGAGEGTFEHTLIVADEGSEVNYIEGCTAQTYSVNSMHSAVVEIFVHEGAKARYTTVQNWSKDVYNLNTKRAVVDAEGTVEWVGGSMGAKYVMLYPGSFLMGEGARADHLNVGVAGKGVHKDTGAKVVHLAPNTTSNILAKSISKDGGIMGYRGLVKMGQNSAGSKARVQCDGLMMDGESRSDTWPDIQIQNPHVTVAHEATVGRISDDQLFYMGSRGFTEDEAAAMIVNGFIEPVTKELPMEYAVELNRLIQLEMVGTIGCRRDGGAGGVLDRSRASTLARCVLAMLAARPGAPELRAPVTRSLRRCSRGCRGSTPGAGEHPAGQADAGGVLGLLPAELAAHAALREGAGTSATPLPGCARSACTAPASTPRARSGPSGTRWRAWRSPTRC